MTSGDENDLALRALEIQLRKAAARLIETTPGADTLKDVARITGRPYGELLHEATGIDRFLIHVITGG
jgi:hypothetical protein